MRFVCHILFVIGLINLPLTLPVGAQPLLQWHSSNLQLLHGRQYEVGADERTILTFEHANGFRYGDFFLFTDVTWPETGKTNYYGEAVLRLSLSKMTGADFSFGLVKDVFLAGSIEKARHQPINTLWGGAVDLDLPGFKFFKTHYYVRDDPDFSGTGWQVTIAWNLPFNLAGQKFLTEGFADFAGDEGRYRQNSLIVPRLLFDLGHALNRQPDRLMVGVEWQYWHNKFGIEGVTESVPQAQIKWVL